MLIHTKLVLWLGSFKGRALKPLGVKWKEAVKITGVYFSYNSGVAEAENYNDVIRKIELTCRMCKQRNLSLIGKVQIVKTFGISKLNFICNMCPVPEWVIKDVNKILYDFIWSGKPAKVKRATLIAPKEQGGLGMVDLHSVIKSQRVMWIKRFLCSSSHPWKLCMQYQLDILGGWAS